MNFKDIIKAKTLIFDGGMGTMLYKNGLPVGDLPELYSLTHPEVVLAIHKSYVEAGADVITTNTFQANRYKIPEKYSLEEIISTGVRLAKESGARFVALDVGPLGQLIEPLGDTPPEEVYDAFKTQVVAGEKAGADCVLFETFFDLTEMELAVSAAKENTSLPILATLTYEASGYTFMGNEPMSVGQRLEALGVAAIGANCSLGPKELLPLIDIIVSSTTLPVMVQPNAGLPDIVDGTAVYTITPEEFVDSAVAMIGKGVSIIGGCCGTTPDFIRLLAKRVREYQK